MARKARPWSKPGRAPASAPLACQSGSRAVAAGAIRPARLLERLHCALGNLLVRHRDVVKRPTEPLGRLPHRGGRRLSRIFPIRTKVDQRPHGGQRRQVGRLDLRSDHHAEAHVLQLGPREWRYARPQMIAIVERTRSRRACACAFRQGERTARSSHGPAPPVKFPRHAGFAAPPVYRDAPLCLPAATARCYLWRCRLMNALSRRSFAPLLPCPRRFHRSG